MKSTWVEIISKEELEEIWKEHEKDESIGYLNRIMAHVLPKVIILLILDVIIICVLISVL